MVKLEVGKYYRRRDGKKVGPMVRNTGGDWVDTHPFACPNGYTYKVDGGYLADDSEGSWDIIAEWADEPASPEHVSPVRTVTRKEIVPGNYGKVRVTAGMYVHVNSMSTAAELRAAIATLTEIADALEEQ